MSTVMPRAVGSLVATIAALAFGGLVVTGCDGSPAAAPASPPPPAGTVTSTMPAAPMPVTDTGTTTKAPRATTSKPAPAGNVIGPRGYGKLTMGMSFAAAKAAGFVREGDVPAAPGCGIYELYVGGKRDGYVHISRDRGVEAIGPDRRVRTPEGVSIGWQAAKVKAIYPDLDMDDVKYISRTYVRVPGSATAGYRLGFRDGVVESISLQLGDQQCYE